MNRTTRVSLSALAGAGLGLALVSTVAAEPPREIIQQQRAAQAPASQVAGPGTGPTQAGKDTIVHAGNAVSPGALTRAVDGNTESRPQLAADTTRRPDPGR
ncbi:hypothetical protein SAMN05216241_10883 [Limimonas halophila]|uniref:Uncharacterized protein n=1 Tax=Limimonas halophila TaxID=1082479 RepID=A0A1G7T4B2_9PROT|nr:hypothetical protein [Limimonas halophila]SDG30068.1 hypothetical protein SAMN05216241_10883 [Limimonas halophila]